MKKILCSLAMVFGCVLSAAAMSYEEAREQALFLTDKMAYELNLNDEQYEYCYEINLDYLMSVETADDVYGAYLSYRNADLRHILFDWQYTIFAATDYFFHPLLWHRGVWTFPIYRHYAYGHFFYHRPHVYISYRGGHGRHFFGAGYYGSRRPHWSGGLRGHDRGPVAHRGDFGRGRHDSYGHTRSGHNGSIGHTRSGRNGSIGHTRSGHSDNRSGYSIGSSRSNDDAYGLGSRTRGNRTGSFGSDNHSRTSIDHSRSTIGNTRSSSLDSRSTVGSGRSVSNDSRSTVGSSRSMNNDARTGSFSRGSSSSYNHPSSTRSFSGASRGSVATRSSSSMGGSRGGASMGSRSGASMGGSRGGSMGSSRGGGAMGGSRGGHSGRGR